MSTLQEAAGTGTVVKTPEVKEVENTQQLKGVWFMPFKGGDAEAAVKYYEQRTGAKPEVVYHLGKMFFMLLTDEILSRYAGL